MSEPTGGGWASPGQEPGARQDPAPAVAPPVSPPVSPPVAPPPGTPGWGEPASGQPAYGQPAYGQQSYGQALPPVPAWGQPGWGAAAPSAPRPGVVPLRPLGLGELLDGAVGLVRGYPRQALGVSAAVAVVTTLAQLVLVLTVLRPFLDVDPVSLAAGDTDALAGVAAGAGAAGLLALVVSVVAGAVLTGFMTSIAGKGVLGEPQSTAQLWASTRRALPRLVGASLLVPLAAGVPLGLAVVVLAVLAAVAGTAGAVLGGLLALAGVVLVVVVYVRLALSTSVLVLEDASIRTSFRRSWRLVQGASWRVLGVLVLTALVGGFVAQVLQLPFALLSGDGGPFAALSGDPATGVTTRALVLSTIGGGVASALVAPFTAGVTALLYVDRRMRAEGLDVALQAAAATRA